MSFKSDIVSQMQDYSPSHLLEEIDRFLSEFRMGEQYFGKLAAGISDIVPRLRAGGSVRLSTAARVQAYMARRRSEKPRVICSHDVE